MAGLKGQAGLWCRDTSAILGHLHAIQEVGFDYIVARIVFHPGGGQTVPYEPANLTQLISDAATINLSVYAWAYCYPDNVDAQIGGIAGAITDPCSNLILDIEAEWETAPQAATKAHQLFHGVAEAVGHCADLHLSTFCNPQDHPVPVTACLAHCESLMPQAYRFPPTSVSTVMNRTLKQCPQLAKQSLGGLLIATVNRPEMLTAVTNVSVKPSTPCGADDGGLS